MTGERQRPPSGLIIREAHFPGRAPIDTYGNGGFRFAEMSHKGSILCLPSGIYGWSLTDASQFDKAAFQRVFSEFNLEIVLIGTGRDLVPLAPEVSQAFRDAGMRADPMSTGAAARTFNVLLGEGRAVGAALLAVE